MVKRYIAALLLIPLADAILLVVFADFVGWLITVLLVVLTGLLGLFFVRIEGRNTIRRFQEKVTTGGLPTDELLDGGLLIAAGAFFLTPGLVTDTLALLFVVPVTRYPIRALIKRIARPYFERKTDGFVTGDVYTGGFPDPEDVQQGANGPGANVWVGQVGPDADPSEGDEGFGPSGGGGFGSSDAREAGGSGDVFDLDEDAYSVDVEDVGDAEDDEKQ